MAAKADKESKWFRILTEGDTADGRVISRSDIEQVAASYDPKLYGARINMEHIRGYTPDSPFRMYGDVLATKAEEQDGKLRLLARISPTDELVSMVNVKRQKVYTSCEIQPNFAKTGGAYLVGLAVTDSPASLGTDMLQFSAKMGANSPLAGRKQHKENLFTVAQEASIEFEDAAADQGATLLATAIAGLTGLLEKFSAPPKVVEPNPAGKPADLVAGEASKHFTDFMQQTIESFKSLQGQVVAKSDFTALQGQHQQLQADFTALKQQLEGNSAHDYNARQPATGGDAGGYIQTDC